MANPQSGNPRAYGQVVVPGGGTPVRATVNQTDPTRRVGLQSITIQVRPANTGLLYIRLKGDLTDDRVTRAVTLAILPAPVSATAGPFDSRTFTTLPGSGGLNLADLYLDVSVNGDGAIISGVAG